MAWSTAILYARTIQLDNGCWRRLDDSNQLVDRLIRNLGGALVKQRCEESRMSYEAIVWSVRDVLD